MAQRMTALVTGGASGLGRATALQLARRGMGVVVADVRNETPFQDENIRYAETDVRERARQQELPFSHIDSSAVISIYLWPHGYQQQGVRCYFARLEFVGGAYPFSCAQSPANRCWREHVCVSIL